MTKEEFMELVRSHASIEEDHWARRTWQENIDSVASYDKELSRLMAESMDAACRVFDYCRGRLAG